MTAEWDWKLREAVDRVRSRYHSIGRKTGAPFLAVVYPPDAERFVLKEWRVQAAALEPELSVRAVDVIRVTARVVEDIGIDAIVESLEGGGMPGSDPLAELARLWTSAVVDAVVEAAAQRGAERPVVVLEHLAALYPACGPRAIMQALWDTDRVKIDCPLVFLVPGDLVEARVYRFVGRMEEFMYRGDVL
jgi:hypothetical protein